MNAAKLTSMLMVLAVGPGCAEPPPASMPSVPGVAESEASAGKRLQGHRVDAVGRASRQERDATAGRRPLALTIVLGQTDPEGFQRFLDAVHDPGSVEFHRFASPEQQAERFGPTEEGYEAVRSFLDGAGFRVERGSRNRLTLTVLGTRAQAEQALDLQIDDYQLGARTFFANDRDPWVPAGLPIQAIVGLSNLARPLPMVRRSSDSSPAVSGAYPAESPVALALAYNFPALGTTGAGQKVGLVEFADYLDSDVTAYLAYAGLPSTMASQVTRVPISGGSTEVDSSAEMDLDIDAILGAAPGAHVAVYVTGNCDPTCTSFETMFQAMVEDADTVISNSWGYCEASTTSADAASIDTILASASASGVSVFTAAGDDGALCPVSQSSSVVSVSVPADAPHGIAVGGTTLYVAAGGAYQSESYWSQGGYGLSTFFPEPSYQASLATLSGRSVPDVAAEADPNSGIDICVGSSCPTGPYGGTSLAAPIWAAGTALLNQKLGGGVGNLNASLYALANTAAFHAPSTMNAGSNTFARLGLGSFNLEQLAAALAQGGTASGAPVDAGPKPVLDAGPPATVVPPGAAPVVTGVSPTSGPAAGGTQVTITGTGFTALSGNLSVFFGQAPSPSGFCTNLECVVVSPPGTGTVDVTVSIGGVASATSSADRFAYPTAPSITAISPALGPAAGGTRVTVTGTGFSTTASGTHLAFGGVAGTSVACSTSTTCTVLSPAGTGSVTLTATAGSLTSAPSAGIYTFVPLPVVTSVSPTSGPAIGGTPITITGTNLTNALGATAVTVGGKTATSISCSDTQCTAVTPSGSGTDDVLVSAGAQASRSSATDRFVFVAAPTITSVTPKFGAASGGTSVTIAGTNLTSPLGSTTILFGGVVAPSVTCASASQCAVVTPSGSSAVDVAVHAGSQGSAIVAQDKFTFVATPTVTGLNPGQGVAAGGTKVIITGANLTSTAGATSVSVGSRAATGVTCASASQCTATMPTGVGTEQIVVSVAGQGSATNAGAAYTYVPLPAITAVSPGAGPAVGGTVLAITGANLTSTLGATTVTVAGRAATAVSCTSSTSCTAVTPSGAGTGDVVVKAGAQASPTVAADKFSFVAAPIVRSISPASGPAAGGTTVTITGTNLTSTLGTTSATLGGASAVTTCPSSTQCSIVTPPGTGTVDVLVQAGGQSSTAVAADRFTY